MANKIYKTICPLPWMHLSAHLDTTLRICCNTDGTGFVLDDSGQTIKLPELQNINDYFNLNYYRSIRKQMLNDEKPVECRKCYQVEEHGGESVRLGYLRQYAGNSQFQSSLANTDPLTGEIEAKVQSLDFSLSNKCNLKCIMCSPSASYLIKSDYDQLGLEYSKEFCQGANQNWSDLSALERIIPQVTGSLDNMLTTGGEPFLSKEHLKIVQMIVDSGNAGNVSLSYHTNCMVENDALFKLWESFKFVSVHFSIDAFGELNEYIRFKTKWDTVEKNVRLISSIGKAHCEVHTTVQALNIFGLDSLYQWTKTLGLGDPYPFHIWMDQPHWLTLDVLPKELLLEAKLKLLDHFTAEGTALSALNPKQRQIISYIDRAMSERPFSDKLFKEFQETLRSFEVLRKTKSIGELVPELKF